MKTPVAAALLLCLTPAFAQDAPPPKEQPAPQTQQSPGAAQTYPEPAPAPPPYAGQGSAQRPARRRLELPPGIHPRAAATAYPVARNLSGFSVGAQLLSTKEVAQRFSTPLGKRYIVVEVGIFPAGSRAVNFRGEEFTLRVGSENQGFFASIPEDIVADLTGAQSGGTAVRPTMGVGYGPWGPTVGVGVGAYPYPPREHGERSTQVMEKELRDKALPEWNLTQPVAGYLYFPVTPKRDAHYTLDLTWNGERVSLALPNPKK